MQTNRSNIGAFVGGAILIAFGLLSLAGQLFRTLNLSFLWPLVVILMGAFFFVAMFAAGKGSSALAIPGTLVSGIGLVMLFQSLTHHWASMSYFWTLIILFVGTGIYIMGWHSGDMKQKESGLRVMKIGFILFVIFGAFFEMIFSNLNNFIFPILLIVAGISLVLFRSGLFGSKKNESTDSLPPTS
jgi:hypothetical protein